MKNSTKILSLLMCVVCVQVLHGAAPKKRLDFYSANVGGYVEDFALIRAIEKDNVDDVKIELDTLRNQRISLNSVRSRFGFTPLNFAVRLPSTSQNLEIIKLLLQNGASPYFCHENCPFKKTGSVLTHGIHVGLHPQVRSMLNRDSNEILKELLKYWRPLPGDSFLNENSVLENMTIMDLWRNNVLEINPHRFDDSDVSRSKKLYAQWRALLKDQLKILVASGFSFPDLPFGSHYAGFDLYNEIIAEVKAELESSAQV